MPTRVEIIQGFLKGDQWFNTCSDWRQCLTPSLYESFFTLRKCKIQNRTHGLAGQKESFHLEMAKKCFCYSYHTGKASCTDRSLVFNERTGETYRRPSRRTLIFLASFWSQFIDRNLKSLIWYLGTCTCSEFEHVYGSDSF